MAGNEGIDFSGKSSFCDDTSSVKSNGGCGSGNVNGGFDISSDFETPEGSVTSLTSDALKGPTTMPRLSLNSFLGYSINSKSFSEDLLDNACEIDQVQVATISNSNGKSLQSIVSVGSSRDTDSIKEGQKGLKKYLGFCLTLLSGLLYSLAALVVKLLKDDYHTFMISIWRFQGVFLPSMLLVAYRLFYLKRNDFKEVWPLEGEKRVAFTVLMLRGVLGCWSVILQFYSLEYLQVADSMVITSSTSVFVTLLAHCFIGERCALVPIITALLTIGGVFVISRPPMLTGAEAFDTDILIGVGMALGCMFLAAVILVIQRYLRNVHFSLISLSSGVWGTLQCLILTFAVGEWKLPTNSVHLLYGVTLATLTFFAQSFIVIALKFEQAGPVAVVQSCDVIFAFLWQFAFLAVIPDYFSLIGSLIIIAGLLLTAFRKCLSVLPEEHKTRNRFRFLLL